MAKKLILKERKLGRERASGQAYPDDGLIEIDPRLTPRQWLSTLIHEAVHMALVKGTIDSSKPVLVRAQSECLTGDVFGSLRCDCNSQLKAAMKAIQEAGSGVLLYIRQ